MGQDSRKQRILRAFSLSAYAYDSAAKVQLVVAERLARRIALLPPPRPERLLEIGCGTGFLSVHLAEQFPGADLLLTDLAPTMLALCRRKVGDGARYRTLDGEQPDGVSERFDLIAASLTFQWFVDLASGVTRLAGLLAPGGRLIFATLGARTFDEWRAAHQRIGHAAGTPAYPTAEDFPRPPGFASRIEEESLVQHYQDGNDFVGTLKAMGAGEPAASHRPLPPGQFRSLLKSMEGGLDITYHLLYGVIARPL